MLGDHPITPVLLATDLAATREFYHDRLGLEVLTESDEAIVFRCGGGTHLDVTKSTVGTADEQTQVSWTVPDLRAEVAELRSRGVKVEDYDMPGLKTEDGIADLGFAWMAWIIDPGKNALAIMKFKGWWRLRTSRSETPRERPGTGRRAALVMGASFSHHAQGGSDLAGRRWHARRATATTAGPRAARASSRLDRCDGAAGPTC